MNGFKTARALVIDDNQSEAILAIHALGLLSVASVYHDGTSPEEGWKKYSGIRLLVLDMVLENRGAPQDNPAMAMSSLIASVEELVELRDDKVVAVCWTKHPEIPELFRAAFESTFPTARLADVVIAEKADLLNPDKVKQLSMEIAAALSNDGPNSLLREWEQVVHDASTQTAGAINDLAYRQETTPDEWKERAYRIAAMLAVSERGTRLKAECGQSAVRAFTAALGPLLADRIEHGSATIHATAAEEVSDALLDHVKDLVAERAENRATTLIEIECGAKLNTQLNISLDVRQGDALPGTVFEIKSRGANHNVIQSLLTSSVSGKPFFVVANGV